MVRIARGVVLAVVLLGCKKASDEPQAGMSPTAKPDEGGPAVTLRLAYSSEKKAWLEEAIPAFLATHPKVGGKAIRVDAKSFGSGEAAAAILDGSFKAHVYSPASGAYLALINQQWMSNTSTPHDKPLAGAG